MQSPTSKSAVGSRRSASQGKQEFCAANAAGVRGAAREIVMLANDLCDIAPFACSNGEHSESTA